MSGKTKKPALSLHRPPGISETVFDFLTNVKLILDQYEGYSGEEEDKILTVADLAKIGISKTTLNTDLPSYNFQMLQPHYGSMSGDDISESVTISVAGTFYPLTTGLSTGPVYGFKFENASTLRCTLRGTYLVTYSLSFETGVAAQYLETAVMVNSTEALNTVNAVDQATANKKYAISGTGILDLDVNDTLRICVTNETNTNAVTIDHCNMSVLQIGTRL